MTKEIKIKYDKNLFGAISQTVAEFNGTDDINFTKVSNNVIDNFTTWAKAVNPKVTVNQIAVAQSVYMYLFRKRRNHVIKDEITGENRPMTDDEIRQKGWFKEFNQSSYMKLETIAEYLGVPQCTTKDGRIKIKTDIVKQALELLSDMNLVTVQQYKTVRIKYAMYVLKEPNKEICQMYPSHFKTIQQKGHDEPMKKPNEKVNPKQHFPYRKGKSNGKKLATVTYIDEFKKAN